MGICQGKGAGESSVPLGSRSVHEDVLFFPDEKLPCKYYGTSRGCRRNNCTFSHGVTSLSSLLDYLKGAEKSLDICVFTITCDEIANEVIAAHKRGIRVRVISDDEQISSKGSDITRMADNGIAVVVDRSPSHMHHKFAILDQKTLLNGSFNWTRQAVLANRENVVITDSPKLVRSFCQYFVNLWKEFGGG